MPINRVDDDSAIIEYARGDSVARQFAITDADGNPVDITTFSFLFTVNKNKNPTSVTNQVFQISGVISDGPAGLVEFKPSTTDTNIEPADYFYDIQMINGTVKQTMVKSIFRIIQDITKT